MAIWTVTSVGINRTESDLHPKTPTSAAVWYGSVENSPQTIEREERRGSAGKFRATSGTATGVTGFSVYVSPDPNKLVFFLIMMPYGTGEVNETRVGFLNIDSSIDTEKIKEIWYNADFGTSAKHEFTDSSGKVVKLYVDSEIDQGFQVDAKFTIGYSD